MDPSSSRARGRGRAIAGSARDRPPTLSLADLPWRSTLLAAVALVVYLVAGPAPGVLLLDRTLSLVLQPWTLLTAHLAHVGPGHLRWDCLGLLLVGLVYEPLLGRRLWPLLLVGALVIDLGIMLALPEVLRYCGLSGLINTLVGAGLVAAWRSGDHWALGLGLLVVAKVAIEMVVGDALLTTTAWPPVPAAHAIGLIAGVLAQLTMGGPAPRRRLSPGPMGRGGDVRC